MLVNKPKRLFIQTILGWLWVGFLAGCDTPPPQSPVLLSSTTYSTPESRQPIAIPVESANHAILVEILGRNANFSSRVLDHAGLSKSHVHLAFLRSSPVYHFIEPVIPRSAYTMEITPIQTNRLASITVNFYVLPARDKADLNQISAWQSLANGLQFVASETPSVWEENLSALHDAQLIFEQYGLNEPALWANFFGAYFTYFPLYRYSEALAASTQVIDSAEKLNLPTVKMLGHQLAGQILVEKEGAKDQQEAMNDLELANAHFIAARQLAEDLGNGFETVWAINNAGIAFTYQDRLDDAQERYGEALAMAIDLQDAYLTNLIGGNMAVNQEKLGHIESAIETLLKLKSESGMQADSRELEYQLSLLGGYYLKLYRFPEALEELDHALNLAIKLGRAESRGRNRLLLGQIYRELGQSDKSLDNLELAVPDLEAANDGRGMRRAWSLSADIHRVHQRYAEMTRDRDYQEQYLITDSDRADWLQNKARDAAAQGEIEAAITLFRQSAEAFDSSTSSALSQLSRLNACALEVKQRPAPECFTRNLDLDYQSIQSVQASAYAMESKFLWAQLLVSEGQIKPAWVLMQSLIEDIRYYRNSLPGVMGAWYWDARRTIFSFYFNLAMDIGETQEQSALESFLALGRIRNANQSTGRNDAAKARDHIGEDPVTSINTLVAKRDQAQTTEDQISAQRDIDQWIIANGNVGKSQSVQPTSSQFQEQLRQLPKDWSLLTFYFDNDRTWSWVANNSGIQRFELGSGTELQKLIDKAKVALRTVNYPTLDADLAELGAHLLGPVQSELRFKVIFIGAGILSDFPIEALVVNGQPFIYQHEVVNALSAHRLPWLMEHLEESFKPGTIFLAGNPEGRASGVPALAGAAQELEGVPAFFPNSTATLYQGADLRREAFHSDGFNNAGLLHIASHATIDREYPELSRILLSGSGAATDEFLTPSEFQGRHNPNQLVVLSACSTVGLNRFDFDNNLGFVSQFLHLGTGFVLASLWPIPDRFAADFSAEFYSQLAQGASIPSALRNAKLSLLNSAPSANSHWSAFQVFSQ